MAYLYRGAQSPRDEPPPTYTNPLSPQRTPNRLSAGVMGPPMVNSDVRGGLTRRFTTNALPTLTPIGQQRRQAAGDYTPAGYARMQMKNPTETAVRHYEALLAQQRQLQAELDQVDPETRREVEAGRRHEDSITQMLASSEPPSPPEYSSAWPNTFVSRPNRYSAASLTSPQQGILNRSNRSSTHLTSPPVGLARPYTSGNINLPSQSVPGSRRQSDDEDDEDFVYGYDSTFHRAAANPNRNSMPITGYSHHRTATGPSAVLSQVNTTSFLFDDEDINPVFKSKSNTTSPPDTRAFLQVQHTADGFPKLIRREDHIDLSSAALDLALLRGVEPELQVTDRATASRHRISLPPSALTSNINIAPLNSILANAEGKSAANNRRSVEVKFSAETKRPALMTSPPQGLTNGRSMSSYSTNDIPTLKSINGGESSGGVPINSPSAQFSQLAATVSHEHNSNTLSRASTGSSQVNRQSQDFANSSKPDDMNSTYTQASSGLQANAAPFGPMGQGPEMQGFAQNGMSPYMQPAFYAGYNMNMLNNGFANMNVNNGFGAQPQWAGQQMPMYPQQNGYAGYQQFPQQGGHAVAGAGRFNGDNPQRMTMQQRRQAQEEALARYNSVKIEDLVGEIYGLCKDQHGCRYLQRKLDERDEATIQAIFDEVKEHIIDLMTDPFGNYLCQKLLECTNDEQRTSLIHNAMPAMTKIALNQHGTRALQKMIEHVTTPQQTDMIIEALRHDVVQLIQDLNGNHVIQKCLNHLTPEDAQFIFDAVGEHCVTVGTHRHGCCVLQRCIDHASGLQKGALVDCVISNAFNLVQDPFGNYVVQYIIDLAEPSFTEPLCQSFLGNVAFLSKQKFSSNVIEKCIRCAGDDTRRLLVLEIMAPQDLEKLLRDSFANYVVQTAMDFADEESKSMLMENVRPIMPSIRSTPYGRRIGGKLADYDARNAPPLGSGVMTPLENKTSPPNGNYPSHDAAPVASPNGTTIYNTPNGRGNRQGWVGPAPPQFGGMAPASGPPLFGNGAYGGGIRGNGNANEIASPTPQRHGHSNSMFSMNNDAHRFGSPSVINGMGRQAAPFGHF